MGKYMSDSVISDFLDDVTEQISYHPLRPSIRQELQEHIQDRMEEYESDGLSIEDAQRRAIQGMGDAVSIGTQLNETHKLQKAPLLTFITVLLLLIGMIFSGLMRWSPEQVANGFTYYIPGGILLMFTIWKGYPFLVRYRKVIALCMVLVYLLQFACLYAPLEFRGFFLGRVKSPYYITMLLAVVVAALLYGTRRHWKRYLAASIGGAGLWLIFMYRTAWFTMDTAIAVTLLSTFVTVCYMIHRGILSGKKKFLYPGALVCLLLLGSPLFLSKDKLYDVKSFISPQSVVRSTWDDAYNGILIQELLARTPLIQGLSLSSEEMMDYGTGAWYFASRNPGQIGIDATEIQTDEQREAFDKKIKTLREQGYSTRYIHFTEENVTLWDILPEHYHNNYLIAVCILTFGWLSGLLLSGGIILFYVLLFNCITRIRGQLALSIAFSCGQCLLWQSVLYILGNFGHQYSVFTNLPLVSEGRISIIFNMLLLGLVFSAYRYDRVIEEPVKVRIQTT